MEESQYEEEVVEYFKDILESIEPDGYEFEVFAEDDLIY
jgi:hypothetical protein